jgi:hypothetical protein
MPLMGWVRLRVVEDAGGLSGSNSLVFRKIPTICQQQPQQNAVDVLSDLLLSLLGQRKRCRETRRFGHLYEILPFRIARILTTVPQVQGPVSDTSAALKNRAGNDLPR